MFNQNQVKTDSDDVPLKPVVITACGDSPIDAPFYVSDNPYEKVESYVLVVSGREMMIHF